MSSLQHQHFRLKRRQCSRIRATGEEFIGGPEKAEQSIEWNPKSYGLLPADYFSARLMVSLVPGEKKASVDSN